MRRHLVVARPPVVVVTGIKGGLYALAVTLAARVAFPGKADGSLVRNGGEVIGSSLLGQSFEGPMWFHSRPGTATSPISGPTNLGPDNPALASAVAERTAVIVVQAPDVTQVPADAVTGGGSGLDPDITVANARLQAPRVARARGISETAVLSLIDAQTTARTLGFLGEPRVNVLALNLALDGLASGP